MRKRVRQIDKLLDIDEVKKLPFIELREYFRDVHSMSVAKRHDTFRSELWKITKDSEESMESHNTAVLRMYILRARKFQGAKLKEILPYFEGKDSVVKKKAKGTLGGKFSFNKVVNMLKAKGWLQQKWTDNDKSEILPCCDRKENTQLAAFFKNLDEGGISVTNSICTEVELPSSKLLPYVIYDGESQDLTTIIRYGKAYFIYHTLVDLRQVGTALSTASGIVPRVRLFYVKNDPDSDGWGDDDPPSGLLFLDYGKFYVVASSISIPHKKGACSLKNDKIAQCKTCIFGGEGEKDHTDYSYCVYSALKGLTIKNKIVI